MLIKHIAYKAEPLTHYTTDTMHVLFAIFSQKRFLIQCKRSLEQANCLKYFFFQKKKRHIVLCAVALPFSTNTWELMSLIIRLLTHALKLSSCKNIHGNFEQ